MNRIANNLQNIASELQRLTNIDNKASLYDKVALIRVALNLSPEDNKFFYEIIQDSHIALIEKTYFKDIYGYLDKTPGAKPVILINEKIQTPNFVLSHELMHLLLTLNSQPFSCSLKESFLSSKYSYEEWRANEGSAELLIPYSSFLPDYDFFSKKYSPQKCIDVLAQKYCVPKNAIKYRILNLENEYLQYSQGIDIEDINIVSRTK